MLMATASPFGASLSNRNFKDFNLAEVEAAEADSKERNISCCNCGRCAIDLKQGADFLADIADAENADHQREYKKSLNKNFCDRDCFWSFSMREASSRSTTKTGTKHG